MKIIKYFRRNDDGNSAGNEPADASSAEYAACAKRLEEYIFALVLFSDPAQWAAQVRSPRQLIQEYKATAVRILEEVKRFEKGLASGKGAHGEAPKNAKKINPVSVDPGRKFVRALEQLPSGRQLIFDLYCSNCYFQCWTCPTCDATRCACESCGCQLERTESLNA